MAVRPFAATATGRIFVERETGLAQNFVVTGTDQRFAAMAIAPRFAETENEAGRPLFVAEVVRIARAKVIRKSPEAKATRAKRLCHHPVSARTPKCFSRFGVFYFAR